MLSPEGISCKLNVILLGWGWKGSYSSVTSIILDLLKKKSKTKLELFI